MGLDVVGPSGHRGFMKTGLATGLFLFAWVVAGGAQAQAQGPAPEEATPTPAAEVEELSGILRRDGRIWVVEPKCEAASA